MRTRWIASIFLSKSALLFAGIFVIHSLIAVAVGEAAWDDGYITLAFARTFAETGHIGLTPYSETVEGATSPAWFLLLAGTYRLGITSPYALHLASQLLAALCAGVAAVLLYRLIRPSAPAAAWWISLATMLLGPFRAETANGMEMTLLCVVVLGIMNLLKDCDEQPLAGLALLTAVSPWIRLEAAGYALMGAVAIIVLSRQVRVGSAMIGACVLSLTMLTVVRYLVFGTIGLTNTMIAKGQSPYTPHFGTPAWVQNFVYAAVVEPAMTFLPGIIVGFLLLGISGIRKRDQLSSFVRSATSRHLPARISFGVAYAMSYVLLILVVGSNYFNRPGRMGVSAMIAFIGVIVLATPTAKAALPPTLGRKLAVVALFLVPCLGIIADDTVWIYMGRLGSNRTIARHSPLAYRKNGEAAEHMRELLGRPTISVLFADVGAASLCCQNIEVLDLGLLANRELSEKGWSGFPDYLAEKRPDLIQTHGVWSQESDIYDDPYFRRNYSPIVVYDSLFYLRNDEFSVLRSRCVDASLSEPYFYSDWEALASKKNAPAVADIDKNYLKSLHLVSLCRLR